MSSHGSGRTVVQSDEPDFDLPDGILAAMPTDPYEQLDLARKITSLAIASRVTKLESDVSRLEEKLQEKNITIQSLEDRVFQKQRAFQDVQSKLMIALDDNEKLAKERDSLFATTKKLSRDLAKLESFKRQLMQSLSDDTSPATEDKTNVTLSVPKLYPGKEDEYNEYGSQKIYISSPTARVHEGKANPDLKISSTPYIKRHLSPKSTTKMSPSSISPRSYSAVTSPRKSSNNALSWYTSSQQPSAASSPPHGRTARTAKIDGKKFFQQARSVLSYEQFSAFLANIKELNARKQTREETLRKAEEIFGDENKDLYQSFYGLLNRSVH